MEKPDCCIQILFRTFLKRHAGDIQKISVLGDFKAAEVGSKNSKIRQVYTMLLDMSKVRVQAEKCVSEFKNYVEAGGFIHQQIFECDEICLFCKKKYQRGHSLHGKKRHCQDISL